MTQINLEETVFLTFDIDWACDEIIIDLINLIEEHSVKATFFMTHDTPVIKKLKGHSLIELGIHPNFNPLLEKQKQDFDAREILKNIHDLIPEAVSVRSHSLFQSSKLFNLFYERGLTYDLNMFIPPWSKIVCFPYKEVNGTIRMPYNWEDDVHAYAVENGVEKDWKVQRFLSSRGLKIFDFHPIHIFLNTENLDRYIRTRDRHLIPNELIKSCNGYDMPGVRNFLIELIFEAKKMKYKFLKISDLKI